MKCDECNLGSKSELTPQFMYRSTQRQKIVSNQTEPLPNAIEITVHFLPLRDGLTAVHVKLKGRVLTQTMASKCAKPVPLVDTCIDL